MTKHQHIGRLITLGSFVCFLSFAGLLFFFRPGTPAQAVSFPEIELAFLDPAPAQIDQWWSASFGGKAWLSERYHQLNPNLKALSPLPQKVIMGQEGWLFHGEKPIAQFRNQQRFSDYELSVLRRKLHLRIDNYQRIGASFHLFIIPNKSKVYPEYLPPHIQAGQGSSQAQQVLEIINQHKNAKAFYLKEALIAAKAGGRLYDKTDTHWNDLGAFAGYLAITNSLREAFPTLAKPKSLDDFQQSTFTAAGRNLARMLGMSDQYEEEAIGLIPRFAAQASAYKAYNFPAPHDFIFPDHYFRAYQNPSAAGPKVFFIRDSFSTQIVAMLSEHFKESYFLWDQWRYASNQAMVEQIQPAAVVVVMLEEHLDNLLRFD